MMANQPSVIETIPLRPHKAEQKKEILVNNGLTNDSSITFDQFLDIVPRNLAQISLGEHTIADLREKFQRYDLDGNGMVCLSEAQWALQMELDVSPQTSLRLLNQFVQLNYDQFVDFYKQVRDKKLEIYEKFGKYDVDKDGWINGEEAHRVLRSELGFNEQRSRAMVQRFDINKDGLVSYIEFAEFYIAVEERKAKIRKTFQRFDEDNRGYVLVDHAKEILQGVLGFSEEKCQKSIEACDKNNDGKIDYEEFLEFYTLMEEERQRLLAEFKRYDANNDGRISFQEFRSMLSEKGHTDNDIENLMAGYDEDKDGFLSFDEFKRFLNFS